jgi:hypothetical protein
MEIEKSKRIMDLAGNKAQTLSLLISVLFLRKKIIRDGK